MARYRSPAPGKSPYITADGFRALQHEAKALWSRRQRVTQALAAAAAEGDRSENAEYIYRKKQLREIDRRIRYLQKRLPELKVVRQAPADRDRVYFGAWVTLETEDGEQLTYRIVGADETDPKRGLISVDSPMGRSLLKRTRNEDVAVPTPVGVADYAVIDIAYVPDGEF
jgi:transcription elongation factor GreB